MATGLERAHLQQPAYRLWERAVTIPSLPERLVPSRRRGSDGLPLPPPLMRVQVTATADAQEFLSQGKQTADMLLEVVRDSGREISQLGAVLDFGCGCGRVMRRWSQVRGPAFFGTDYNARLIDWCRQNLPFATFTTNDLAPRLPYEDEKFDLVYALSVFTHLTIPMQHEWIAELRRVLKPGGLLIFTTRGDAWAWKLTEAERERYQRGEVVVRYDDVEGTNLCAAFHPVSYVHDKLADSFSVRDSLPARMQAGSQDVHVMERLPA